MLLIRRAEMCNAIDAVSSCEAASDQGSGLESQRVKANHLA